ncbi:MAG: hypothetical protein JNJ40_01125 [Bacteroidia bacterium]|nr:hypothetical protein [Bacteroidia bacterium]
MIYKNGVFGIFKDDVINSKTFSLLFLLKALAVPVFYLVYKKLYGGVEKFDAGKFYADAATINSYAYSEPFGYLKLLFGLQDESEGTNLYSNYITHTTQWDNGRLKEYFYNDNRIVIRVHSLLHFIAFNSYFVHALFSCSLSFIGITFLYKSVKDFFKSKELFVLLVLCSFPALWFYTGAVLKEGLVIFIFGGTLYLLKKLFSENRKWLVFILLLASFFISFLLKPYILLFAFFTFSIFFWIYYSKKIKLKCLAFLSVLVILITATNFLSVTFKHRSLLSAALKQQRMFADASKGGIFLMDRLKFVRLDFDSTLVKKVNNNDSIFTIKKDAPYIYWEHWHQQDTLFTTANTDTITQYKLVYQLPKSGSNINFDTHSENIFTISIYSLYYSMFYPLFFNSKSLLQHLASFENLLITISIVIFFIGLFQNKKDNFPAITFMVFALLLCLLIGLTTPNSGAIFRYRSPAVIFILLAALYYIPVIKNTKGSGSN